MAFLTDGKIGINLTDTTAGTTTDGEDAKFALGTVARGSDNSAWVYVQASAAVTQYDWVGIDENFQAAPLTKAMADDGWQIGVSQVAASDNDFLWVCTQGGNVSGNVLASCNADVALYTSATAGALDDTSTSQTKIDGVVAVTANTVTVTASEEVLLTFPRSTTF